MTKKKSQRKAGNTVKEPSSREIEKAGKQLIQYLLAGAWLAYGIHLITRGDTCVITLRRDDGNEQTDRQAGRISYAGSPDSEIACIGMQEVPDEAPRKWLRKRLREHFAVASESVLILIPSALFEVVMADYLSKDLQRLARQYWNEEVQNEHWTLCQTCQREVRDLNSLTGFVSDKTRSGEYINAYTTALNSLTAASVLRTGRSPLAVCALVRKGQMPGEESFANTGSDVGDGMCDGWCACRYLGLTRKGVVKALDLAPQLFALLGWEDESIPDEYEDED